LDVGTLTQPLHIWKTRKYTWVIDVAVHDIWECKVQMINIDTKSKEILTEEVAFKKIRDFFREKPFLVFGTGMSCALDTKFGMHALQDELLLRMKEHSLNEEQNRQWEQVEQSLEDGLDLESSLDSVTDSDLLKLITKVTGNFIASIDRKYAFSIANGEVEWPAISLIKRMVETLPEGDPILHVLTPNYDMLFEYTCDCFRIPYTNGFTGGVERSTDWDAVNRSLLIPQKTVYGKRNKTVYKTQKHIRLYKVHGSLNYFFHRGNVVENNAWMWDPPNYALRVIITPGLSKYETLHRYRQELLKSADLAIDRSNHFLFLGYGFNDKHLEEYIKRKLVDQSCMGLIVTRDSNPRIESLLFEASNLWLICRLQEQGNDGTRIYNKQHSNWLNLPGRKIWDIQELTSFILGG
jgi:hypothetical protein